MGIFLWRIFSNHKRITEALGPIVEAFYSTCGQAIRYPHWGVLRFFESLQIIDSVVGVPCKPTPWGVRTFHATIPHTVRGGRWPWKDRMSKFPVRHFCLSGSDTGFIPRACKLYWNIRPYVPSNFVPEVSASVDRVAQSV
jgi:hypothetical protein